MVSEASGMDGWRVWSIDGEEVTLISAGSPELHRYSYRSGSGDTIEYQLLNRDCSMYENEYAQTDTAHFLTAPEFFNWYNYTYGTTVAVGMDLLPVTDGTNIVLYDKGMYTLATKGYSKACYYVGLSLSNETYGVSYPLSPEFGFGLRVLITLKVNTVT